MFLRVNVMRAYCLFVILQKSELCILRNLISDGVILMRIGI